MPVVEFVRIGAPAEAALHRHVAALQRGDPLRPVTVAVPSGYARLLLRRGWPHGLGNVRFESLNRVAELLGAPFLAEPGRAPLDRAVLRERVRAALAGRAAPVRVLDPHGTIAAGTNPAGLDALTDAVGALWAVPAADLAREAAGHAAGGLFGALVALHREVRARLADRYDDEEQLRAAADQVRRQGAGAELGPLVAFLPRQWTPGTVDLLTAWAGGPGVTVLVGLTGDEDDDTPVRQEARRLAERLGVEPTGPDPHREAAVATSGASPSPAPVVRLAPDPDTEVRMVVGDVLAALEAGTPAWRIAVAYATADPYARLLPERFAEAGIPVSGPSPHRLADRAAGRFLLRALAAADPAEPLARLAVLACLDAAPVHVEGVPLPAARADRLTRRFGIAGGLEGPPGWSAGLERARTRGAAPEAADADPDAAATDDPFVERLGVFVAGLAGLLHAASPPGWDGWAQRLRALLDDHLRLGSSDPDTEVGTLPDSHPRLGRSAPDAEHAALDEVRRCLDRLATLPGGAVPHAVVTDALTQMLAAPAGRLGSLEQGVFLAPLPALWATTWERVFIVGLAEGHFPPRGGPDVFLDDGLRARLGLGGGRADRVREARRHLAAARAAAPSVTCSCARADPAAGTALMPSPVLVAAARQDGEARTATELVATAADRHPSFPAWLHQAAEPLSLTEWECRALDRERRRGGDPTSHRLVDEIPELATARACVLARASTSLTDFDGVVGRLPGLPSDRPLRPSQLQAWGECPFRYFLEAVCGLRRTESPEDTDELDPRTRGTAVHEILQRFFQHHQPDPEHGWSDTDRAALTAIAEEVLDRHEAEGGTGHPRWWAVTRREILAQVRAALARDAQLRREHGERPTGFEVAFGDGDAAWPTLEVLPDGASAPVRFAGRIDRVDEADDGSRVTLYDYKTGRPPGRTVAEHPLEDPLALQLAVYGMAARNRWPDRAVRAAYWYTSAAAGEDLVVIPLGEAGGEAERLVTRVAAGIVAGFFPLWPGTESDWPVPGTCEHCRFCDFHRVCPADRALVADRKRGDPAWAAHPWAAPAAPEPATAEPKDRS